eukprot:Skav215077  [mRNA]  locus=scaffold2575:93434:104673:- [translate_table: standard]
MGGDDWQQRSTQLFVHFGPAPTVLDSLTVLTGGDDKTARIWKASRTDPLSWEQVAVLHGHCDSVRAVAWRPDEKARSSRVVIAAGLADSTIVLWHSHMAPHDRRVFEVFATLSGHSGAVRSLDWTWDGAFLASGSTDATARIWNSEGWHEVAKLERGLPSSGNCAGLKAVAWSPDGKHLAAGGARGTQRWERPPVGAVGDMSWVRGAATGEATDPGDAGIWGGLGPDREFLPLPPAPEGRENSGEASTAAEDHPDRPAWRVEGTPLFEDGTAGDFVEDAVERLVADGFDHTKSLLALEAAGGDETLARTFLWQMKKIFELRLDDGDGWWWSLKNKNHRPFDRDGSKSNG